MKQSGLVSIRHKADLIQKVLIRPNAEYSCGQTIQLRAKLHIKRRICRGQTRIGPERSQLNMSTRIIRITYRDTQAIRVWSTCERGKEPHVTTLCKVLHRMEIVWMVCLSYFPTLSGCSSWWEIRPNGETRILRAFANMRRRFKVRWVQRCALFAPNAP